MKLEILSFSEALKYFPEEKSYAIRISGEFDYSFLPELQKNNNWIGINNYYFDDKWPTEWKEYSWYDTGGEEFQKYLQNEQKKHPNMTKESLMGYFESRGHPYGRDTLFDDGMAIKILNNFENVRDKIENVVVHCIKGKNRSPAIGIAMNEIYGWGIEGLEEKFPEYRRFVHDKMIEVSKNL